MSSMLTLKPAHASPPMPTANVRQTMAAVGVIMYAVIIINTVCPRNAANIVDTCTHPCLSNTIEKLQFNNILAVDKFKAHISDGAKSAQPQN